MLPDPPRCWQSTQPVGGSGSNIPGTDLGDLRNLRGCEAYRQHPSKFAGVRFRNSLPSRRGAQGQANLCSSCSESRESRRHRDLNNCSETDMEARIRRSQLLQTCLSISIARSISLKSSSMISFVSAPSSARAFFSLSAVFCKRGKANAPEDPAIV